MSALVRHKWAAILLCLVLTAFFTSPAALAAEDFEKTKTVYEPQTGLVAAPTVMMEITDKASSAALIAAKQPPQVAVYSLKLEGERLCVSLSDGSMPLQQALDDCGQRVIPLFSAHDRKTAVAFAHFAAEKDLFDVLLACEDPAALEEAWTVEPTAVRYVLRVSADGKKPSAAELAGDVHAACANVVLLPAGKQVNRSFVEHLQQRFVSVWLTAEEMKGDEAAVRAALDCGANGVTVSRPETAYGLYGSVTEPIVIRKAFVIGHRGYPEAAPENTVESALEAVKAGADAVECDIYLTKDNHIVVSHNATLKGLTVEGSEAAVEDSTLAELKAFTYPAKGNYSGCRVATLAELFDALKPYPDVVHVVEIKSSKPEIVDALDALIQEKEVEDQVVVISFSTSQLKLMRAVLPRVGRGLLVNISNVDQSYLSVNEYLSDIMDFVGPAASVYDPFFPGATTGAVEAARHRGIPFWPWTMNSQADFEVQRMNGVAGLTTDHAPFSSLTSCEGLTADEILGGTMISADEKPSSMASTAELSAEELKQESKFSPWPWMAAAVILGAAVWITIWRIAERKSADNK